MSFAEPLSGPHAASEQARHAAWTNYFQVQADLKTASEHQQMYDAINYNDNRVELAAGTERRWVRDQHKTMTRLLDDQRAEVARCNVLAQDVANLRQRRGSRGRSLFARITLRPNAFADNAAYKKKKVELGHAQASLAYTENRIKEEQREIDTHQPKSYDEVHVPMPTTYTAADMPAILTLPAHDPMIPVSLLR